MKCSGWQDGVRGSAVLQPALLPPAVRLSARSLTRPASASARCPRSARNSTGCPLTTPFGKMEGTYQMVTKGGIGFDAKIAPFTLSEPYTVH